MLTVVVERGPSSAPPVGLDKLTVKFSTGSLSVSRLILIGTYFAPPSPSSQETVVGVGSKSDPALALPELGVTVTETAPLV